MFFFFCSGTDSNCAGFPEYVKKRQVINEYILSPERIQIGSLKDRTPKNCQKLLIFFYRKHPMQPSQILKYINIVRAPALFFRTPALVLRNHRDICTPGKKLLI